MYKLDDESYDAASLGDILTKATEDWIQANKNEIYSINSIKTQLHGYHGMVSIEYYLV